MPETRIAAGEGRWPMALWQPLPGLRVLRAPVRPRQDLDGSPLGTDKARNLREVIGGIRSSAGLPKVIVVHALVAEGPAWSELQAMVSEGAVSVTRILGWRRALLMRSAAPDAESYLAAALSASTRKSLRRKRRALEEAGPLRLDISDTAPAIEADVETFCRIEAAGWKGRNGTALAQEPDSLGHVRTTLRARAGQGAFTAVLRAGDRPVAAGLFLRDGGEVSFWKTTYDETLAKHSPGVVFDVMLTEWLLARPWFERLDSGHDDSVDPASLIWSERREMAMVVIDLKPGSLGGRAVATFLRLRQALRAWRNRRAA